MLDILVTVGVILLLIALAALMLHLVNTHQEQRVAASDYERFHAGEPPRDRSDRPDLTGRKGEAGKSDRRDGRERDGQDGGGGPPPPAGTA